jgi:hypothetical protein
MKSGVVVSVNMASLIPVGEEHMPPLKALPFSDAFQAEFSMLKILQCM